MTTEARNERSTSDAQPEDTKYASRHVGDPDPRDPGFCCCGLGLDAWVHTDTTHYDETPLGHARRDAPRAR